MSDKQRSAGTRHLIGLVSTMLAIGLIALFWSYGLAYLNGTIFEELRYVIFAVVVVGLLSGLQNLFFRIMH